jgi:hypothetical protein
LECKGAKKFQGVTAQNGARFWLDALQMNMPRIKKYLVLAQSVLVLLF